MLEGTECSEIHVIDIIEHGCLCSLFALVVLLVLL
jgi:hypothetical protein